VVPGGAATPCYPTMEELSQLTQPTRFPSEIGPLHRPKKNGCHADLTVLQPNDSRPKASSEASHFSCETGQFCCLHLQLKLWGSRCIRAQGKGGLKKKVEPFASIPCVCICCSSREGTGGVRLCPRQRWIWSTGRWFRCPSLNSCARYPREILC
jgi:hypothetical protein